MMYVPHGGVADWSLERSAFFVLLRFGSLQAACHTLCLILGLDPKIHKPLKWLATMDPRVKPEDDGRARG
jgi:hypothetical protein